jgi:predicted Zn finger-like uncharacterized protein
MPVIVACPSCGGKLRIADALRGQRVRCPACNHTFDGEPPADAAGSPLDLPLQLAIDEPSTPPLELSPPEAPPPELPPPEAPPPELPPRSNEDDDLKECPVCGKHIHRDSTRCYNCGERFDERRPSWDRFDIRRREPRRDSVPDRGGVVLSLGIVSLACLFVWCAPIGVILGLTAWIMGQSDLRKIKSGQMDVNGRGMTQAGWICGILGTLLNGLATLGCVGMIGAIWYSEMNRAPNTRPISITRPAQKRVIPPPGRP